MSGPAYSLDGASVLVVGASGGLGTPLVAELGRRGARLTLVARDEARLRAVAPAGSAVLAADLRDPRAGERAVEAAVRAHGRLDGVVQVAGVVAFGPLTDLTDDVLEELVATNLTGPIRLMRAAVPRLREAVADARPGDASPGQAFLVNVSAVVAENPVGGMAAYSATKAGLAALDAAVARELRSARIRVIDARPPHSETGLSRHPIAGATPPLPRGAEPAGVAARIVQAIVDGERDLPSAAFR